LKTAGAPTAATRSRGCGSRRYALAAAAAGFASVVVQVSLLRGLLVSLKGNELHAGIVLCMWLGAGALGSFLAPAALGRLKADTLLAASAALCAALSAGSFLFTRYMRALFPVYAYVPGPWESSLLALAAVSPAAFLFGLLLGVVMSRGGGAEPASYYMYETVGILGGGLFFTFAVTRYATVTHGILFSVWLLVAVALAVLPRGRAGGILLGASALGYLATLLGGGADAVERWSRAARYMKGERLDPGRSLTTPYGVIDVTESEGQVNVYHNGAHVGDSGGGFAAEEIGAVVNLLQPQGGAMLLVGATISRIPLHVLHWGRWRIDALELDPGMARVRKLVGPSPVAVVREDPVAYPARTEKKYDAVTVRLVLPSTLVLNRLYTREYFASLKRVLAPGGVLYLAADVPPRFAPRSYRRMAAAIFAGAAAHFRRARVMVMDHAMLWVYTDASLPPYEECLARFLRTMEDARRMSPYTVEKAFRGEESRTWEKILRSASRGPNTVARPRAVDNYIRYWSAVHGARPPFSLPGPRAACAAGIILIAGITGFLAAGRRRMEAGRLLWMTALAGFAGMAFEMLLVYLFQMTYGSFFSAVGLLFASFMCGSGVGAFHGRAVRAPGTAPAALVFAGMLCVCAFPAAAYRAATAFAWIPFLLNAVMGYGVGMIFALLSRVFCARRRRGGGPVYGADLAGGCAAGIVTGVYLLPCAGVVLTGLFLACACGAGAVLCLAAPAGTAGAG